MHRAILAAAVILLAACQPTGREAVPDDPPAEMLASDEIAVTPLGPPVATEAPQPKPAAPPAAASPPETTPPPPEPPKSAQQTACERKGGRYAAAGASGARACVSPTRDAGKRCARETDCEGLCLARSQSCAPIKPLFGCNDILQADGRPVTLCVD